MKLPRRQAARRIIAAVPFVSALSLLAAAETTNLTVRAGERGKPISTDLVGIFFEDLSYAADGGLYAELVQNRSFEYSEADLRGWHPLTSWELVERNGGRGTLITDSGSPLHPNNPRYAVLGVAEAGEVGLKNSGFDGIPVKAGERYRFSVFARQLAYPGGPLTVRLESKTGELLGEAKLPAIGGTWKSYGATITATASAEDANLVLLAGHRGRTALDMISLFPEKTFKNRPNGLRADLAQSIADLKPKFMRFPGGCLVHGDGLDNIYHWKNTIGPVEQRKGQRNIWNYHQSAGLGYFEYFQFCEDIGARPLPVIAAGVTCQNSGASITRKYGEGQQAIPMEEMRAYIQDALDLIEYANGPASSTWGAKRAAAGHPAPFGLKYLGVGNEDHITPAFEERFRMIHAAVRAKHPEITVIGTVGPNPDDNDYRKGWRIARDMKLEMVDEHCYRAPQWFWDNLGRWDSYDRKQAKVYLGEWAAHDDKRRSTLRAAIAEAAYLTAMERNGDIVRLASYAPLLAKKNHTHWSPNLIYFDNTGVYPTISWQVQRLFATHHGDHYLTTEADLPPSGGRFAASAVRDGKSGDLILKFVNGEDQARPLSVRLAGLADFRAEASVITVAGADANAANDFANPRAVTPTAGKLAVGATFAYQSPANSLTVIRVPRAAFR